MQMLSVQIQILFLQFIERVGKVLRTALRDSLISAPVTNCDAAGWNFGFHKAMDNSGAILGPLAAFVLLYSFPLYYDIIFLFATIPAVMGAVTIIAFIREVHSDKPDSNGKLAFNMFHKKFWFFLCVVL